MRHQSSGRRSRNRGGSNRRGNQGRSQVFDSNGPDVRIRGTAHQIHEKYMALAKDAAGSGDRILEESYLQHAEHYQRVINSWAEDDDRRYAGSDDSARQERRPEKARQGDDLGLPASILGAESKQEELADA